MADSSETFIVNVTAKQYADLTNPPSFIDKLNANPMFWVAIVACILIIGVYIIWGRNKNPTDPSVQPWYFRIFRRKTLEKEVEKRADDLAEECNIHLVKGSKKLGLAVKIEHDVTALESKSWDRTTNNYSIITKERAPIERLTYRKYGLWSWLKALFGWGMKHMVITPDARTEMHEDKGKRHVYYIDPRAHLINDSGVWTVQDERSFNANYELVLKADDEQLHGSGLDMLRRLAVHSVQNASKLEEYSHLADIKKQQKMDRSKQFTEGGN